MNKVKEGELDKLGLLFERYKGRLFGFFYNLNGNVEVSEDLVHTVFERVINYRTSFKGTGEFRIWLFYIARNANIDHYRLEKKKMSREIEESDYSTDKNISHEIEENEDLELLKKAMDLLPEDKRIILSLSKIEGLKYAEIGKILDLTETAVKTRVFRAFNQLRSTYLKLMENS